MAELRYLGLLWFQHFLGISPWIVLALELSSGFTSIWLSFTFKYLLYLILILKLTYNIIPFTTNGVKFSQLLNFFFQWLQRGLLNTECLSHVFYKTRIVKHYCFGTLWISWCMNSKMNATCTHLPPAVTGLEVCACPANCSKAFLDLSASSSLQVLIWVFSLSILIILSSLGVYIAPLPIVLESSVCFSSRWASWSNKPFS